MSTDLIDQYENGADKLKQAIFNLTKEDLLEFPVPGTWSIQQNIIHLLDSDLVLADRMKRVIAEENPTLQAFDESKWVERLAYEAQPAEEAAAMFAANRRLMATILRVQPPEAFDRIGTHSEAGVMTLRTILQKTVAHLDHHLKHVYAKREKLGKLMW